MALKDTGDVVTWGANKMVNWVITPTLTAPIPSMVGLQTW